MKHLSINQRLRKTRNLATKREIVSDWARNWEKEQLDLLDQLRDMIGQDRLTLNVLKQLYAVTDKRFSAIPGIIDAFVVVDAE